MRGLGTVIGIIIFLLILLAALALITIYMGEFEAVGAQLSQAQINIYDHNNAKLGISVNIKYSTSNVIVSNNMCISGLFIFYVTVICYTNPVVTVTINNPSQITQTIVDLIISAGNPDKGALIGTNQNGVPPNYETLAYQTLTQLFIDHMGYTLAPGYSYTTTLTSSQIYSAPDLDLYVPFKYYEVKIDVITNLIPLGTYYYAYFYFNGYKLYYPYYGAPPDLPGTSYVPTDWNTLPQNPVNPYGNLYFITFSNFGNVASFYYPLGGG